LEPNFEGLFGIPHHNRLMLIRSRARGGIIYGVYWTHHEVDRVGAVVALYETYDERDGKGHPHSGWRKYGRFNRLVVEQAVNLA